MFSPPTSLLTTRWYAYDIANSPFFCSVLNLLPLLVQGQAASVAKKDYCGDCENNEWAANYTMDGSCAIPGGCFSQRSEYTLATCDEFDGTVHYFEGSKMANWTQDGGWQPRWKDDAIMVDFLGMRMGYASIPFIATTFSVLLQLVVFVLGGALADYGSMRKKMFMISNTVGSLCCLAVYFGGDAECYTYNAVLLVIANVSFGFAIVFYNAYLPLLTCAHPDVVKAAETGTHEEVSAATPAMK